MIIIVKLVLAILLIVCLFDMPYGYFQLVRFLSMVIFGFLAYDAYLNNRQIEFLIFLSLAILFQPLLKIALGRTIWNIVDVIVAIGLIISILGARNSNIKKHEQ